MIDTQLMREYLMLLGKIEAHEDKLKELKGRKKELAVNIHTMLTADGTGKVNVDGVTIYPRRTIRASAHVMPMLIEAMKEEGLNDIVSETINSNTLTGWVNQFDPDKMFGSEEIKAKLPEAVRPYINIYEQLELGVRRDA